MHLTWKLSVVKAKPPNISQWIQRVYANALKEGLVPLTSRADPSSFRTSFGIAGSTEIKPQLELDSVTEASSIPNCSESLIMLARPRARFRVER
jgi:hypothetical protein